MYKEYLALNNLQWLICHKTQPNRTLATCVTIMLTKIIEILKVYHNNYSTKEIK